MSFEPEHYVNEAVVRHHLGDISRMTIWRYVHEEGMPCHMTRTGRRLFLLSEVDAWLFADEDDSRFKRTSNTGEGAA